MPCHLYFRPTVRSNLIPSPPTYNTAHDYISWESFSNVSYYTRILPSVPKDCPTPMGTKGKEGAVVRNWLESSSSGKAITDPFHRWVKQGKTACLGPRKGRKGN